MGNNFKLVEDYKKSTFDFDEIPNNSTIWNHWDRHREVKIGRNPEYDEFENLKENLKKAELLDQVEEYYTSPEIDEHIYTPRYVYYKRNGVVIRYDHKHDTKMIMSKIEMTAFNGLDEFRIVGMFTEEEE